MRRSGGVWVTCAVLAVMAADSVFAQPGFILNPSANPSTGRMDEPPVAIPMVSVGAPRPLVVPHQQMCTVDMVEARPAGAGGGAAGAGSFLQVHQRTALSMSTAHRLKDLLGGQHSRRQLLRAEARGMEAAGGGMKAREGGPEALVKHVCHYSGVSELTQEKGATVGQLVHPENIMFKRVAQHYFSCIDPRAKYAVLGTPGGDIAEFITALAAMETLNGRPYVSEDVAMLFQQFLRLMLTRGRSYFYMHTDEKSHEALAKAAGTPDPTSPATPQQRNKLLQQAIVPDHVGCQHLKGMLSDSASFGVRKELVEWVMQSYLSIYFDPHNPLRSHLIYVISKGEPKKAAGARIWSPDACPGMAPLLVPNTGKSQAAINHAAHAEYFRQDLARFFAYQNAMIDAKDVYSGIQALHKKQAAKLDAYVEGEQVDVIFKSKWDSWPF